MTITKAVLPVAGLGTRLLPATKSQPKEMLPVGHKPVVQYVVEELVGQGIDTFLFVTARKKGSIEDHYVTFLAGIFRSVRFGASSAAAVTIVALVSFCAALGAKEGSRTQRLASDEVFKTTILDPPPPPLILTGTGTCQSSAGRSRGSF